MGLALYLILMGVFFAGLGAFARWAMRQGGPGTPGVQSLSMPLAFWGPVLYYGGLAALAAGLLLGLVQLVGDLLG